MKIDSIKIKGFGISIIAFPVMLLIGFLMHPNLLKLEALQTVDVAFGATIGPRQLQRGMYGLIVSLKAIRKTAQGRNATRGCFN